jgi:hypothetical protein
MVFSDLALMNILLYYGHYGWYDAILEEMSPDKKKHYIWWEEIPVLCIVLVSVYFSIF